MPREFHNVLGALRGTWEDGAVIRLILVVTAMACACVAQTTSALQREVTKMLAGRQGTALVVDVQSGRVLAAYRPEVAAKRLVQPGSAIKPFSLLAMLEADRNIATTKLSCRRQVRYSERNLDCTHVQQGRALTATEALTLSCNSWFVQAAARHPKIDFATAYERVGLTSASGFLPRETVGNAQPARTPEEHERQAVGDFGIRVTPAGLLAAYRKLALKRSEPGLQIVFEGLEQVVAQGTATSAQVPGMRVAGKTGTAASGEGYAHGWFVGFAPADKPQVAVVVFVERGHGRDDAAALAGQILAAWKKEAK